MLTDTLAHLPVSLQIAAEDLLDRFQLRANGGDWSSRFSELTLQYPQLQLEGAGHAPNALPHAMLAHQMLLIHTFLEDRLLDGQMRFSRSEVMFVKQMLLDGIHALDDVSGDGIDQYRGWRKLLLDEYARAQSCVYLPQHAAKIKYRHVRRVASGRAALGVLSALSLLCSARADSRTLRTVKNTYDCLVTALQWADDISDWKEDLQNRDDNLLLAVLQSSGLNPYTHPPNTLREVNVGHALLERHVLDFAADQARRWFEMAVIRERRLGCHKLAELIESGLPKLTTNVESIRTEIEQEIDRFLAISRSVHTS